MRKLTTVITSSMLAFAATHAVIASTVPDVDYTELTPPEPGSGTLHILTPVLLELELISSKQPDPAAVSQCNFVDGSGNFAAPSVGSFNVTADGQPVQITGIGFKRRPLYAPLVNYDLRVENCIYLQLATPLSANANVQVSNPDGSLWPSGTQYTEKLDTSRYNPAIHVNQEGYLPSRTKQAIVGYFLGDWGEMLIPASEGFTLVDNKTGHQVFKGNLVLHPDVGYNYSPTPYQNVYVADFSSFNKPGEYRVVLPSLGSSLPFVINSGIAMDFARAYALGLYHQRCGADLELPYTRFNHGKCHTAPASVPTTAAEYPFTWTTIAGYANQINSDNPTQIAPALTSPDAQLFPYINQGPVDVSGGHHDAGDYSKYTANSANLIHTLIFAVDSLPGVAAMDNMGIPESGDGKSDIMQEAKWEADFLAKMQDADGGFYFLVYPQNREYEINVPPDQGDPQVVWPKTTSVTAASVAALAQMATSPTFKRAYPKVAQSYMAEAQKGWQFLMNAINKYGKNGAYQKITHYGDTFADNDEMAWAACQMYLATHDPSIHKLLLSWFDPSDPSTWRWGWWHMSQCYGHAIRSYAFAVQSGRAAAKDLDATFLAKCKAEIIAAGDDMLQWSKQNAYGTSFPDPTKAVESAGWYFSADQAFDMAVAYQLNHKADYISAMLANMNYEGGCNPVNASYITGLGSKRQRNIVSQWAINAPRALPPSGLPIGNIQAGFFYLWNYQGELSALCYPPDGASVPYPYYDRWGDVWNVSTEMVVLNEARGLGTLAFLAGQTTFKGQGYRAPKASISLPKSASVGASITATLKVPGMSLTGAKVVWEASGQDPQFGSKFTFSPSSSGTQWVEAEAQWPDGRRAFARATFNAK